MSAGVVEMHGRRLTGLRLGPDAPYSRLALMNRRPPRADSRLPDVDIDHGRVLVTGLAARFHGVAETNARSPGGTCGRILFRFRFIH